MPHRIALLAVVVPALSLLSSCDETTGPDDPPDDVEEVAECAGAGSFDGCADLDGVPQECPGNDFAASLAHVAWTGTGGFHDEDGFTLILGPGDRDLVLALHLPGGLTGPGEVPLDGVVATAWDVSDLAAPVPYPNLCGGQLRIDTYTPGEGGQVSGLVFLYLGATAAACSPFDPEVQLGAEFDVPWQDPTCDEAEPIEGEDPVEDPCAGTATTGCMDPAHGCPDYTGPFDPAALGAAWWDGEATATTSAVEVVTDGSERAMTVEVGGALEPGRTYQFDEVTATVTGAEGIVRERVCGGVLVVDAASTAESVTGAWLWYIDTVAGDCVVWEDVLQTSGQFTAAPVCK